MENNNINENKDPMNNSGKIWAGLIIVVVGSLLLVNNIGFGLPSWLFHWSNILILIGLFIGVKHNFKNGNGLILIIIGSFFTLKEVFDDVINFDKIGWPALIIALGLFLILKPKSSFNHKQRCGKRRGKWQRTKEGWKEGFSEHDPYMANPAEDPNLNPNAEKKTSSNDYLDSVNVFGGSHQTIYSKNFKGGEVTAVFGGCDLNLTQADFEGEITIDITAIFGGCKIIIPPGWHVKSEVTAIFGGLDDKRSIQPLPEGPNKLLIIKGIAMFGGVDIRNY
jgi:predicted membrane protein